jgi:hypothetical protein
MQLITAFAATFLVNFVAATLVVLRTLVMTLLVTLVVATVNRAHLEYRTKRRAERSRGLEFPL